MLFLFPFRVIMNGFSLTFKVYFFFLRAWYCFGVCGAMTSNVARIESLNISVLHLKNFGLNFTKSCSNNLSHFFLWHHHKSIPTPSFIAICLNPKLKCSLFSEVFPVSWNSKLRANHCCSPFICVGFSLESIISFAPLKSFLPPPFFTINHVN